MKKWVVSKKTRISSFEKNLIKNNIIKMKNKQKVIVITGLGGTWKTYLAKHFSRKLNIVKKLLEEIK